MIEIKELIRSKRRTITLQIKPDGSLIVKAPLRVDISRIYSFISQKNNWIITKQLQMQQQKKLHDEQRFQRDLERENYVFFLNEKLPLKIAKNQLISWYKKEALNYIIKRVDHYTNLAKLKYRNVKINNAKKRWGSCSSLGNINFSWRLIMAPKEVVDYVVVHEISHLRHQNHSKKFWRHVEILIPDYQKHRQWLKQHGFLLDI